MLLACAHCVMRRLNILTGGVWIMKLALLIWGGTIVSSIVFCAYICNLIEKTKVKRWGATGKLFKYE